MAESAWGGGRPPAPGPGATRRGAPARRRVGCGLGRGRSADLARWCAGRRHRCPARPADPIRRRVGCPAGPSALACRPAGCPAGPSALACRPAGRRHRCPARPADLARWCAGYLPGCPGSAAVACLPPDRTRPPRCAARSADLTGRLAGDLPGRSGGAVARTLGHAERLPERLDRSVAVGCRPGRRGWPADLPHRRTRRRRRALGAGNVGGRRRGRPRALRRHREGVERTARRIHVSAQAMEADHRLQGGNSQRVADAEAPAHNGHGSVEAFSPRGDRRRSKQVRDVPPRRTQPLQQDVRILEAHGLDGALNGALPHQDAKNVGGDHGTPGGEERAGPERGPVGDGDAVQNDTRGTDGVGPPDAHLPVEGALHLRLETPLQVSHGLPARTVDEDACQYRQQQYQPEHPPPP